LVQYPCCGQLLILTVAVVCADGNSALRIFLGLQMGMCANHSQ
jgi:hypothetical protein